jgi:hypothetical protein
MLNVLNRNVKIEALHQHLYSRVPREPPEKLATGESALVCGGSL